MRARIFLLLLICRAAMATTYEIGSGQAIEKIQLAPWGKLAPGDIVQIHWREQPYHVKFLLSVRGTEVQPITIRGVPGPNGELPVISGDGAVTPPTLDYWGGDRAVIKIGQGSVPKNVFPNWIVIENLEVRNARQRYSFTDHKGRHANYSPMAAPIWIESGNHITIRNCILRDGGNGFFVSFSSHNVTMEGCYLYDNGVPGNTKMHNVYTEANGIIFQYNHFGPLIKGAQGNNLKDRSCGTVIRYNWIEGGNREIDLVDAEGTADIRNDPKYRKTFVYGNIIVEPQDQGNQIVHYGGDSGNEANYRKGTLFFYNNTVISRRTDTTCLFRIQTSDEKVDCRNNIIYWTGPGKSLALVDSVGTVELHNNWMKKGWVNCHDAFSGRIIDKDTINGSEPGFVDQAHDKFQLNSDSPCINAAGVPSRETLPVYAVTKEYVIHQKVYARNGDGDIGAFSFTRPK